MRAQQNSDEAVAWGVAAAAILERVVLTGCSPAEAVAWALAPGSLAPEAREALAPLEAQERASVTGGPPLAGCLALGRSCWACSRKENKPLEAGGERCRRHCYPASHRLPLALTLMAAAFLLQTWCGRSPRRPPAVSLASGWIPLYLSSGTSSCMPRACLPRQPAWPAQRGPCVGLPSMLAADPCRADPGCRRRSDAGCPGECAVLRPGLLKVGCLPAPTKSNPAGAPAPRLPAAAARGAPPRPAGGRPRRLSALPRCRGWLHFLLWAPASACLQQQARKVRRSKTRVAPLKKTPLPSTTQRTGCRLPVPAATWTPCAPTWRRQATTAAARCTREPSSPPR